jgi:hypothetical protein
MPTIHGYSNIDLDVYRFSSTVDTNPAASGFDANIYKTVFSISQSSLGHRIYFKDQNWGGAALSAFRFQFVLWHGGNENLIGNWQPMALFKNLADGRDLFRLMRPTGGLGNLTFPYYWDGSAWQSVGAGFIVPTGPTVHDIEIVIADSGGSFRWWMNGALLGERLGDTKLTASTEIDCIDQYGEFSSQFGWTTKYTGLMLTSEDYAPYGLQNVELQGDGIGTDATQDSGLYSNVNELTLNRADGMTFDTVGDHATLTFSNLAGAVASSPVMGVRLCADVRRGATGPANVKLYVKIGGTRYYSPSIPVNGIGFTAVAWQWDVNPATSAPWTNSDINALEGGIEAA